MTSKDPVPPSRKPKLFRREAVAEQQDRWLGTVLIAPSPSHRLFTALVGVLVAGIVGLFALGEYTRKTRISGWLAPEMGLIQIVAPQGGVLTRVHASEGDEVEAGAPLAVVSAERRSEAFGATQTEILRALRARRDSLSTERDGRRALFRQATEAQEARLALMAVEAADLEKEFALQRARLARAESEAARQRDLRARGILPEAALGDAEEEALDQALALQTLERQRTALARARIEIEAAEAEAPLREALEMAEIDRAIAALEQELAEAEAAREVIVAAPQAGTVTALQVSVGGGIASADPLMTLVPRGARLEARLYGPSRSIGFVRPGQRVLIRYEAYPHQKFGHYSGEVTSVSRATVGAGELAERGAAGLAGIAASGEPVYRITVSIDRQTATAYGEAVPLQPGMTLEADIQIETRRIYEWVLDPIYSLTGRGAA